MDNTHDVITDVANTGDASILAAPAWARELGTATAINIKRGIVIAVPADFGMQTQL